MTPAFVTPGKILLGLLIVLVALVICSRAIFLEDSSWRASLPEPALPAGLNQDPDVGAGQAAPIISPTPDKPHDLPDLRGGEEQYTVQANETLNQIAQKFGVSISDIVQANGLSSPDLLEIGQVLTIPPQKSLGSGPDLKIIPDSELVYSPATTDFHIADFVQSQGGYLAIYNEDLEGRSFSGAQVVERIAQEYSVNPRLLLAVLEYLSGWVTKTQPSEDSIEYPLGIVDARRKGLYRQLAWSANNLNRGYYLWRVNALPALSLADGQLVPLPPTINAGTAGVQHFFAQLHGSAAWEQAISGDGLLATYNGLFGSPFSMAVEPLLPPDLTQPPLQLPFEPGQTWAYTGGPHGGWGNGSAWAAIDFAPPGRALGCVQSDAWVVAVVDGIIVRAGNGAVLQDLDDDGFEQTGWTVLYLHIESRDRVLQGTYVRAGERIGHPSCEGGVSTGTHLHLARRYNGEWIPADQDLPFVLDGWVSSGQGSEYNGYLQRDGQTVEALNGRSSANAIGR